MTLDGDADEGDHAGGDGDAAADHSDADFAIVVADDGDSDT